MLPDNNIPTMLGLSKNSDAAIAKVLAGLSLDKALYELGEYFQIKIWFSQPVRLIIKGYYKETDVHVFPNFFFSGDSLCYTKRRKGRRGYHFEHLDKITKFRLIDPGININFESYEDF